MEGKDGGYSIDCSDAKYVSRLSTILVATIEEAKDRISQIEYIFCSQLFPNIELRSKNLQEMYSKASKAAEDAWKKKENNLLLQIGKLEHENQKVLEENQSLQLQKKEPLEVLEEDKKIIFARQKNLEKKVWELEGEVRQKSKEIDEGMELQSKLLQLVQSKASAIGSKKKQLKEHEDRSNSLLENSKNLERKIDVLHKELTKKIEEVAKGKEMQQDLLETIKHQASEISESEQKLNDHEKEKKLITNSLKQMRETVGGLQEELRKKTKEVEEGRMLQEQLIQQIDLNSSQTLKNLKEHESEKKFLEAKVKGLEERVDELQMELRGRGLEASCKRETCRKLLECIELKASELMAEKNRKRDIVAAYKRLKSQYNFLCSKYGLSIENTPCHNRIEEESDSLGHTENPTAPTDLENKNLFSSAVAHNTIRIKNEISSPKKSDNKKPEELAQASTSQSRSNIISSHTPKCSNKVKNVSLAGSKRPASHWRETRSHQNQDGHDPHDDFLDTPFENIRENLNKTTKEEVHLPVPVPKDMNFDCSDDETQDLKVGSMPQKQQMEVPKPGTKGYKYIEPVRKKAERENLKGIECKQCKKFYDAVLPDGGAMDVDGNERNLRCEHHDGISRHRYRYAPPMTPEGFWNIGFESEM